MLGGGGVVVVVIVVAAAAVDVAVAAAAAVAAAVVAAAAAAAAVAVAAAVVATAVVCCCHYCCSDIKLTHTRHLVGHTGVQRCVQFVRETSLHISSSSNSTSKSTSVAPWNDSGQPIQLSPRFCRPLRSRPPLPPAHRHMIAPKQQSPKAKEEGRNSHQIGGTTTIYLVSTNPTCCAPSMQSTPCPAGCSQPYRKTTT